MFLWEDPTVYDTDLAATSSASSGSSPGVMLVQVALVVATFAGLWKMFTKAGQPGWAAIVPIYNMVILLKLVGRPIWWILLFIVPLVNIVIAFILAMDTAKAYGKSGVFGFFGLFLFSFVGYPMLGFGNAQYLGPKGGGAAPAGPAPAGPTPPPPVAPQAPAV